MVKLKNFRIPWTYVAHNLKVAGYVWYGPGEIAR
jgi:hypothetical protein